MTLSAQGKRPDSYLTSFDRNGLKGARIGVLRQLLTGPYPEPDADPEIVKLLEAALADLDGFYTFAVGTTDGFAILRDPIACKPAVLAETDDWVAMATEYRAIATLPGAAGAEIWEPRPATVYSWQRQ